VTIHASDPFPQDRSPLRRLRGRLPAAVTLWTGYGEGGRPAGLTVSSTLVADGTPGSVLGLLDDESELYAAVLASGRFVVTVLDGGAGQLADRFAGLLPAPGGLFAHEPWERTEFGPVRSGRHSWIGCTLTATKPVGYGVLVEASIDRVELGEDETALVRHRGRYVRLS
jgi:3-hydroxy-9,10-secoandrosta-1,3,5(10)-triene-9,17-dione monooxygenase reductase component